MWPAGQNWSGQQSCSLDLQQKYMCHIKVCFIEHLSILHKLISDNFLFLDKYENITLNVKSKFDFFLVKIMENWSICY